MRPATRIIVLGAVAVVAFDAVASLLLRWLGGSLLVMFLGEGLLYLGVGFAAGRIGSVGAGARSAAIVAAVDATAGWAISWAIGPGRVVRVTPFSVAFIVLVMVIVGAIAGGVGAFAARLVGRRVVEERP